MKKLIKKHQNGTKIDPILAAIDEYLKVGGSEFLYFANQYPNIIQLPKKNIFQRNRPYINAFPNSRTVNLNQVNAIDFSKYAGTYFSANLPLVNTGGMYYYLMRDNDGNIVAKTPVKYSNNGLDLEKEYTTEYIKLNNGQLPWWYDGSMPDRTIDLPEVEIVGNSRKRNKGK